jgi:hypothetical protein
VIEVAMCNKTWCSFFHLAQVTRGLGGRYLIDGIVIVVGVRGLRGLEGMDDGWMGGLRIVDASTRVCLIARRSLGR